MSKYTFILMPSLIFECYRALMTHASVPKDQRELLGISDTLVSYDYC